MSEDKDILETSVEETLPEETPKEPVPWYRNTRIIILLFVTVLALYWIITGLMGYFK